MNSSRGPLKTTLLTCLAALVALIAAGCPPAAPTALTAAQVGAFDILLAWTDNSDRETGYRVYRSTDGETFFPLEDLEADVTEYLDEDAPCGVGLTYYVIAKTSDELSDPSNEAGAATDPCPPCFDEEIACGDDFSGDTGDGFERLDYYRCLDGSSWRPAKERIYRLAVDEGTVVRAELTPSAGCGLALFLLTDCDDDEACLTGGGLAVQRYLDPRWYYYLAVDGAQGEECAFDLSLECVDTPAFSVETVRDERTDGVDLALGADGAPRLAYIDDGVHHAVRGAQGWTAERLTGEGTYGSTPSIGVDAGGNTQLVYFAYDGYEFFFQKQTAVGWETESLDAVDYITDAELALDAAGNAHVAYTDPRYYKDYGFAKLLYATNAGGAWQTEVVHEETFWSVGSDKTIAIDGAGTVHLAYDFDEEYNTHGVHYAFGGSGAWTVETVAETFTPDTFCLYAPIVALDPAQEPEVFFEYAHQEAGGWMWYWLNLATRPAGGWEVAQLTNANSPVEHGFDFAIAADGTRYITAEMPDDDVLGLFTDLYGSWVFVPIATTNVRGVTAPIAIDEAGNLHTAWSTAGGLFYATTAGQ